MEVFQHRCWLGHGSYGDVQLCEVSPQTAAMLLGVDPEEAEQASARPTLIALKTWKQAHKDAKVMRIALREVQILKVVSHPNIIRLQCAFRTPSGRVCMAFEYGGKSTHHLLESRFPRGIPQPLLRRLAFQLVQALRYLHSQKIVHRDVKPANVLVDAAGVLRLCDFGFARYTAEAAAVMAAAECGGGGGDGGRLTPYVITRWYRAPEVLLGMPYGTPTDLWSLGCTLAELATGEPLLPGETSLDQLGRIDQLLGPMHDHMAARAAGALLRGGVQSAPPPPSAPPAPPGDALRRQLGPRLDPDLLDLVAACLRIDPRDRPTAEELLDMPYFADAVRLFEDTPLARVYGGACGGGAGWRQWAGESSPPAEASTASAPAARTATPPPAPPPPPGARCAQSVRAYYRCVQPGGGGGGGDTQQQFAAAAAAAEPSALLQGSTAPYRQQRRHRPQYYQQPYAQAQIYPQQQYETRARDVSSNQSGGCRLPYSSSIARSTNVGATGVAYSSASASVNASASCSIMSGATTATRSLTSAAGSLHGSLYGSSVATAAALNCSSSCRCCCHCASADCPAAGGGCCGGGGGSCGGGCWDCCGCAAGGLLSGPGFAAALSPASQAAAAAARWRPAAGPTAGPCGPTCGVTGAGGSLDCTAAAACWHATAAPAAASAVCGCAAAIGGQGLPKAVPSDVSAALTDAHPRSAGSAKGSTTATGPWPLPPAAAAAAGAAASWPFPAAPSGFSREAAIRAMTAAAAFAIGEAAAHVTAAAAAPPPSAPAPAAAAAGRADPSPSSSAAWQPSQQQQQQQQPAPPLQPHQRRSFEDMGRGTTDEARFAGVRVVMPYTLNDGLLVDTGVGGVGANAGRSQGSSSDSGGDSDSSGISSGSGSSGISSGSSRLQASISGGRTANHTSDPAPFTFTFADGGPSVPPAVAAAAGTVAAAATAATAAAPSTTTDPWVTRDVPQPWRPRLARAALDNADGDDEVKQGEEDEEEGVGDGGAGDEESSVIGSGGAGKLFAKREAPAALSLSSHWLDAYYHNCSPPVTSSAVMGTAASAATAAARLTSTTTLSFNWRSAESPVDEEEGGGDGTAAAVAEEPTLRRGLTAASGTWASLQQQQQQQQPAAPRTAPPPEKQLEQHGALPPPIQTQPQQLQQQAPPQPEEGPSGVQQQEEEEEEGEEGEKGMPGELALVSEGLWPPGGNAVFTAAADGAREGIRRRARAAALPADGADIGGVDASVGLVSESESEGCRPCDLVYTPSALRKGYASAPGCGFEGGSGGGGGGSMAAAAFAASGAAPAAVARGTKPELIAPWAQTPAVTGAAAAADRQPLRDLLSYNGVKASALPCGSVQPSSGASSVAGANGSATWGRRCGAEGTQASSSSSAAAAASRSFTTAASERRASMTSSLDPASRATSCRTSAVDRVRVGGNGDGGGVAAPSGRGVGSGSGRRVNGWLRRSKVWLKQVLEGGPPLGQRRQL